MFITVIESVLKLENLCDVPQTLSINLVVKVMRHNKYKYDLTVTAFYFT